MAKHAREFWKENVWSNPDILILPTIQANKEKGIKYRPGTKRKWGCKIAQSFARDLLNIDLDTDPTNSDVPADYQENLRIFLNWYTKIPEAPPQPVMDQLRASTGIADESRQDRVRRAERRGFTEPVPEPSANRVTMRDFAERRYPKTRPGTGAMGARNLEVPSYGRGRGRNAYPGRAGVRGSLYRPRPPVH